MSRRKDRAYWRLEDNDSEDDTDRGPLSRLVEFIIAFVIGCFFVKLGIEQLLLVRVPLLIIIVSIAIIWIAVRTAKWRDRHDNY